MLYVFCDRTGTTQNAWLSSESEANSTHDRRLSCSISTDNNVQSRSWKDLYLGVCPENKFQKQNNICNVTLTEHMGVEPSIHPVNVNDATMLSWIAVSQGPKVESLLTETTSPKVRSPDDIVTPKP